jgi:hypothetical protein
MQERQVREISIELPTNLRRAKDQSFSRGLAVDQLFFSNLKFAWRQYEYIQTDLFRVLP